MIAAAARVVLRERFKVGSLETQRLEEDVLASRGEVVMTDAEGGPDGSLVVFWDVILFWQLMRTSTASTIFSVSSLATLCRCRSSASVGK